MAEQRECPFCGFKSLAHYAILLHLEQHHPEGRSPFVPEEDSKAGHPPSDSDDDDDNDDDDEEEEDEREVQFDSCPVDDCEEVIAIAELDDHLELHAVEEPGSTADTSARDAKEVSAPTAGSYRSPYVHSGNTPRDSRPATDASSDSHSLSRQARAKEQWKQMLHMPGSKSSAETSWRTNRDSASRPTLGAELGRFAHEDKMPNWLVSLLKKGVYESTAGVIPVLEQLLQQNPTTQHAYLCHPATQHISKLRREGGFCGYRNIQMLVSYITGAGAAGAEIFRGKIPTIFRIQDYIEHAWDQGINARGRTETGGIRGTRKYIGTPEAQAMFMGLQIPCDAKGFNGNPGVAEAMLFNAVESYFMSGRFDPEEKVRCTGLPPIYFQHRGHSLTIVGLEKRTNNTAELLVFDPMFRDPSSITCHVGRRFVHRHPDDALKLYRRGNKYLKKYTEFEILKLRQNW
ncbi:peptidase family C78-domain-containing protein [Xylariomycetidae sp. FL2044]|nr:peptidase family C78-domain-containing protein [Xylariomycetidae sp. FL2044]